MSVVLALVRRLCTAFFPSAPMGGEQRANSPMLGARVGTQSFVDSSDGFVFTSTKKKCVDLYRLSMGHPPSEHDQYEHFS
jgi:hypothetical protein